MYGRNVYQCLQESAELWFHIIMAKIIKILFEDQWKNKKTDRKFSEEA